MDTRDLTGQNAAEPDPFDLPPQRGAEPLEPRDAVPGRAPLPAVPAPTGSASTGAVPTGAGSTAGVIRTSDEERDEALRTLAAHYAAGRLETAEFDARADVALAARTRDDLRRLFLDLPGGSPASLLDAPIADEAVRYPRPARPGRLVPGRPYPLYQQRDRRPYRGGFGGPPAVGRRLTVLAVVLLAAAFGALRHGYFPFPLIPALFILSRRPWRWN